MKLMLLAFPMDPLGSTTDLQAHYRARHLHDLVLSLERCGWSIDIYTGSMSADFIKEEAIGKKSRVIRLPVYNRGSATPDIFACLPDFLRQLKNHVKYGQHSYVLIQSHYWLSGWLGMQLQQDWNIPHIHAPLTLGVEKLEYAELNRYSPLAKRIIEETRILSTANGVVAACPAERENIWRKYGLRSVDVQIIPNGVDTKLTFSKSGQTAERTKGKKVILYTGGLSVEGGLQLLTEALSKILNNRPRLGRNIELWILGNPPVHTLSEQIREDQAEQLAHLLAYKEFVKFIGLPAPTEMAKYYRAADLCIVPDADEGLDMSALEAMASACPVIGPRVNRLRHIVIDGESGLLLRPQDANALTQAVERLLIDTALRKRMSKRAAEWVQESFDIASLGKRWDDFYQEVIKQQGKSRTKTNRKQKIC